MVFDLTQSIDFRNFQGICAVTCRKHSQKTGTNSTLRVLSNFVVFCFFSRVFIERPVYKVRQTCWHSLCDYQYQYAPTFTP